MELLTILAMDFVMPDFGSSAIWMSLLTLTFLEIILGIDNIIFISLAAGKLPKEEQQKATNIGLVLAMVMRILLLFGVSWLVSMKEPFYTFDNAFAKGGLSWQAIILFVGGIFLIYKSTTEISHKLEGDDEHGESGGNKKVSTLMNAIVQITVINIVFSFDSILTAVGMTNGLHGALVVMVIAVVLSVGIMMAFAAPVGRFVNEHPSIQMLGMAFLILIGFMLITEAAHLGHIQILGSEVGAIPKGYLYFAIAFSLFVEFLNMRLRKRSKPVQLHGAGEEAEKKGILK